MVLTTSSVGIFKAARLYSIPSVTYGEHTTTKLNANKTSSRKLDAPYVASTVDERNVRNGEEM
jgi:hypothetical protein